MTNNIINQTSTPCCIAVVSSPITNLTGDGTVATVVCNSIASGSGYNTSTGVFTATMSGEYLIVAMLDLSSVTSTHTPFISKIIATSGIFQDKEYNSGNSRLATNQLIGPSTFVPIFMNVGDTVSMTFQISGSTKTVGLGTNTVFSIVRFM